MKRIVSIIFCGIILLSMTGCSIFFKKNMNEGINTKIEDKIDMNPTVESEDNITITILYDTEYKWEDNGDGSTIVFKDENTLEMSSWAKDAGGTDYKGTYESEYENGTFNIVVTLTEYYDIMEWSKLTDNNIFEFIYVDEDTLSRVYNGKEMIYKKQ